MNKGTNDGGCGLFNFMGKKEEDKAHHNDTVMIDDVEDKHSLREALHRTHSNSSSSSDDEEVEEGSTGEKKRKKKGLKEKMSGTDHDQQKNDELIPMAPNAHEEDKKIGLIDKIKENFPGHHNKTDQQEPAAHTTLDEQVHGGEPKDEKKGLLDKIMEKLPNKNNDDEEKHKSN
ncbi:hypothetical protein H5410_009938 [Solanum commersonii]|uniref:Dehydrin n=1 Tax=Solanum commersonii TaxID=4109 RepID=A0A9J6AJB1_SOLCO|nr:hypothetical protein H5410_009938 [Solanum commersonii]